MALDIEKCKECYYADEDGVCDKCCVDNAAFEPKRPNERICEWISVKDRLPRSSATVLAYIGNKCFLAKYLSGAQCWCDESHSVVHPLYWMPLPEPPKGE